MSAIDKVRALIAKNPQHAVTAAREFEALYKAHPDHSGYRRVYFELQQQINSQYPITRPAIVEPPAEAWDDERKAADAGTPVLGKGTKWITTDIDPQKLQLLESRSYSVAEAARLTGVPENLLGSHDKTSSWGAGIAEQNRGLLTYTIDPDMVIVETTCSDTLMRPGDYMKVERGGLLRGSPKEQAEVLEIERRNLVINADEWRELTDREPLPNGQGQAYINPNTSKNGGGAADQGQTVAEPVPAGA